jgi:hypothetical protein
MYLFRPPDAVRRFAAYSTALRGCRSLWVFSCADKSAMAASRALRAFSRRADGSRGASKSWARHAHSRSEARPWYSLVALIASDMSRLLWTHSMLTPGPKRGQVSLEHCQRPILPEYVYHSVDPIGDGYDVDDTSDAAPTSRRCTECLSYLASRVDCLTVVECRLRSVSRIDS